MKKLFTNKNFLIVVVCIGGLVGYLQALISKLPQILCSTGYDPDFASILILLLVGFGFIGGIITTAIFRRTGKLEEHAKITYALAVLLSMPILNLLFIRDQDILLGILMAM